MQRGSQIEREYARIVALTNVVPIMCLPTEIRNIIYESLAPIDQFRVNICPNLCQVFNPNEIYKLDYKDDRFTLILYMYSEAHLFDKIFPALYNEYLYKGWPISIYSFDPFNQLYYLMGNLDEYYLFTREIFKNDIFNKYDDIEEEYNTISVKEYIIFIRFCLIKLAHDRSIHSSSSISYVKELSNEYWNNYPVFSTGLSGDLVGVWGIYYHIYCAIMNLLIYCTNEEEMTDKNISTLYDILSEYYINNTTYHMPELVKDIINKYRFDVMGSYDYFDDNKTRSDRLRHIYLLHIDHLELVYQLFDLEKSGLISLSELEMYIVRLIKKGIITSFISSELEREITYCRWEEIEYTNDSKYSFLLSNPYIMKLENFRINFGTDEDEDDSTGTDTDADTNTDTDTDKE